MSDIKRYEAMGPEVIETPTGEFVLWEDYAALQVEVQRLRKAGDALSKFAMHNDTSSELWIAWNAAKEAKQP